MKFQNRFFATLIFLSDMKKLYPNKKRVLRKNFLIKLKTRAHYENEKKEAHRGKNKGLR